MKKNLEIIQSENKSTAAMKPYARFKTSEGWMSCFDLKECEKLKKLEGNSASVEVTESKTMRDGEEVVFHNITKCYGNAESEDEIEVVKPGVPQETKVVKANEIQVGVYTSYAKDVFCAVYITGANKTEVMKDCIDLVKQAKKAFE
jgi:hypothetical protein